VEEDAIVILGREVAAGEAARGEADAADGRESAAHEGALDIALEKLPLEIGEEPVAVEAIVGGGKTTARDGADRCDRVEHSAAVGQRGAGELLHDAVGEGGGAGATAGEEQGDDGPALGHVCDVGAVRVGGRGGRSGRGVERGVGAACGEEDAGKCERQPVRATEPMHGGLPLPWFWVDGSWRH